MSTPLQWQRIRGPLWGSSGSTDLYCSHGYLIVSHVDEELHPVSFAVYAPSKIGKGGLVFVDSAETLDLAKRHARDWRRRVGH